MQSYEPSNFDSDNYDDTSLYNILLLNIVILLIFVYLLAKCGILKRLRHCIKPKDNREVLALQDIPSNVQSTEIGIDVQAESVNEPSGSQPINKRRSLRLMRIRT